jgi:hypothetical protein
MITISNVKQKKVKQHVVNQGLPVLFEIYKKGNAHSNKRMKYEINIYDLADRNCDGNRFHRGNISEE